jgi:PIN domain nuclease of toxin-antitoxin system
MNLLIDTHVLIWFITDSENLPVKTKHIIENKENNCFISIASLWEIGIKHSIGRLNLLADLNTIFQIIEDSGFDLLPITSNQILANASLAFHHQDPFDHMTIAQAITESLIIISKDGQFEKYEVAVLWEK